MEPTEHEERRYYTFVEQFEIDGEDQVQIILDGLPRDHGFVQAVVTREIATSVIAGELKYSIFSWVIPHKKFYDVCEDIKLEEMESQWVGLAISKNPTPYPIDLFEENNRNEAQRWFVKSFEAIDWNDARSLQDKISLNELFQNQSGEYFFKELQKLSSDVPEEIHSTVVFNVGQGACHALYHHGAPFMYFDVGGGSFRNRHTYLNTRNLCVSQKPTILLSHWDVDHVETAVRDTRFHELKWIVPLQAMGLYHLRLAYNIARHGQLWIWPNTLHQHDCDLFRIVKCTGPNNSKNHSGLALYLKKETQSAQTLPKIEILLPADAAYCYIPDSDKQELSGLVATHHGAEFPVNNNPVPVTHKPNAIVYSFGNGNSYHHPRHNSIVAHTNAHRVNRFDSINGDFAFLFNGNIPVSTCGNRNCDLNLAGGFPIP
jgi:hypothetical protein